MRDDPAADAEVIARLRRRLQRSESAREEAETILEQRNRELWHANRELMAREGDLLKRLNRESRLLLRAQRTAQMASFHIDRDGNFSASPEFQQLMGLDEGHRPDSQTFLDKAHRLDRGQVMALVETLQSLRPLDEDREYELRILRHGRTCWLRCVIACEQDELGNVEDLLGTIQDITEQRRSERRERALGLVAERRVRQLTRLSGELRESRHATEQAYQARSEFLQAMSHEIRTPLNGLLGMLDLLSLGELNRDQAQRLTIAREASTQLHRHIEKIVDLAYADTSLTGPPTDVELPEASSLPARLFEPNSAPRWLVVDDIETNRLVLCQMLDVMGCRSEEATDGDEAVEKVLAERFDGVLMDIMMPRMSGNEAVAIIRTHERLASLPIIAVTAHTRRSELVGLIDQGFSAALNKPVDRQQLAALMRQHMLSSTPPVDDVPASPPQASRVPEAALDEAHFLSLFGALPADRRELLLQAAIGDIERLVEELDSAFHESNNDRLQRAAHSLKGVAGNFGATGLLESVVAFRQTPFEKAEPLLKSIQQQGAAVITHARALFQTMTSSQ
ncbi:response regulator [Kushneria phyllosphaerae]|uniref:histidine kinase n=1 Tax=Kushneria phyllosphaerae TaxID=2100822 RepID=A0A2R8CHT6_9GAMM|nr:response regulator [Kushneria phyllosphaerae]SPJ32457.1 Chemotaxis protein CheY [Kushneria phyllosphaerae]